MLKRSCGRKPLVDLSRRQRNEILREFQSNRLLSEERSSSSRCTKHFSSVDIPLERSDTKQTLHYCPPLDANDSSAPSDNDSDSINSLPDITNDEFFDDESIDRLSQSSFESISAATVDERLNFKRKLASWVVDNSINAIASDKLLEILRSHQCFSHLPKSTKTLVDTPRRAAVLLDVPPGQYLSFGLETAITNILENADDDEIPSTLEIDISTDGAELDNSGHNQIWPIQCRVSNLRNSLTEVIGIYRGTKKPHDFMVFFQPLVDETNALMRNDGIHYRQSLKKFVFRSFIADAPARAVTLNHKGHTSEHPCSKCNVSGVYVDRRMTFCGVNFVPRTDEQYNRQVDEDHHKEGPCPLSLLPISLVTQVPFEYMHLVLLGVVKRLLSAWIDGKFLNNCRLSAQDIACISMRLVHLSAYCPREFARPPRDLKFYSRYKATEFRQFLLYTGPAVLFGLLNDDLYNHFLLLHMSLRILACQSPSNQQLIYAKSALRIFVEQSANLYGKSFVSYNVHGLLHLVDDVKMLGPVDSYSAFPYENNMQIFRKYCRKPDMPLQQIANRRAELAQRGNIRRQKTDCQVLALEKHLEGPLITENADPEVQQYRRLKCSTFVLTRSKRDNCCILKNSSICIVVNIIVRRAEHFLIVKKFDIVEEFYDAGMLSSSIGYYKCRRLQQDLMLVKVEEIMTKCYLMRHWQARPRNENGQEFLLDDVFVVATMSCNVNY